MCRRQHLPPASAFRWKGLLQGFYKIWIDLFGPSVVFFFLSLPHSNWAVSLKLALNWQMTAQKGRCAVCQLPLLKAFRDGAAITVSSHLGKQTQIHFQEPEPLKCRMYANVLKKKHHVTVKVSSVRTIKNIQLKMLLPYQTKQKYIRNGLISPRAQKQQQSQKATWEKSGHNCRACIR